MKFRKPSAGEIPRRNKRWIVGTCAVVMGLLLVSGWKIPVLVRIESLSLSIFRSHFGGLPVRDLGVDTLWGEAFVAREFHAADNTTNQGELVVRIINRKVAVDASGKIFDMEDANANTMKSSHVGHEVPARARFDRTVGTANERERLIKAILKVFTADRILALSLEEIPETHPHLLSGFISEGDC